MYLEAVFAIVEHYKVRRRTKKLLRHSFKFANLPFDKNANPFTAVIRCTCDDNADRQDNQQMGAGAPICRSLQETPDAAEDVYEGNRRCQRLCCWLFKA
jgi:hypothetical protein